MTILHRTRQAMFVAMIATLAFLSVPNVRAQAVQEALARFPVAHQHSGGWCLGYLYIYPDSIAYDTTWPTTESSHSFKLNHSELKQVGRWTRSGQSLKAVELKYGKTTQHFWWLANEQDVINGKPYQNDPEDAGDPDLLIAAIRDPATLSSEASPPAQVPPNADSKAAQLQQIPDSPIISGLASPAAVISPSSSAETRFAVAHAHALLYCVGYLYVSPDHVRYEVVQPEGAKKHTFNLSRTEITGVQQWFLEGQPRNAAEIRTSHGNYHFWLLPDGSDLVNTPYKQWNANNVVSVAPLIGALQGQR